LKKNQRKPGGQKGLPGFSCFLPLQKAGKTGWNFGIPQKKQRAPQDALFLALLTFLFT